VSKRLDTDPNRSRTRRPAHRFVRFGVGPIIACSLIRYTGDVCRFANRDQFAAYNGTAPIEHSSGGRVVHRLSRRGNRRLNEAVA
jgi:transposase